MVTQVDLGATWTPTTGNCLRCVHVHIVIVIVIIIIIVIVIVIVTLIVTLIVIVIATLIVIVSSQPTFVAIWRIPAHGVVGEAAYQPILPRIRRRQPRSIGQTSLDGET